MIRLSNLLHLFCQKKPTVSGYALANPKFVRGMSARLKKKISITMISKKLASRSAQTRSNANSIYRFGQQFHQNQIQYRKQYQASGKMAGASA
jgi:hypothetical protein